MQIEYVSWTRFARLCGILYRRIDASGWRPDMIIAIARGGYPAARVLADYFDLMDLVSLKIEHYRGPDKLPLARVRYPLPADIDGRRVLLVDDVSDSGDSLAAALEHLAQRGTPAELQTAVLHHKQTASIRPDYHAQRMRKWRWITYPWAVVEDLTVLTRRLDSPPRTPAALRDHLATAYGLRLPGGLFDDIAPIVLAALERQRSSRA